MWDKKKEMEAGADMVKKAIPREEFVISVYEDGLYQRCPNCGKEAKLETKEGRAELNYCPECGAAMNPNK